jgi:peptidoglycan-N-acetylglucosamine deacetylase
MGNSDVWFATLEQVARHVTGLIAAGLWSPRVEKLPFYDAPVLR